MNILYIYNRNHVDVVEYLGDCIFHGFKSLDDVNVYCLNEPYFMFDDSPPTINLYGMGFSITKNIDSKKKNPLTQKDVEEKISNQFFDLVVFGSPWLPGLKGLDMLPIIVQNFPKNKIVFIDGNDLPTIAYPQLVSLGWYFKREIHIDSCGDMFPISFGIPEEKIVKEIPNKERLFSPLIPGDLSTYIYSSESDYYKQYRISKFGLTWKKGGWDCMRHYEILANGCLPYFDKSTFENCGLGLDDCPKNTLTFHRKDLYKFIIENQHRDGKLNMKDNLYQQVVGEMLSHVREHLTTKAMAKYILETVI